MILTRIMVVYLINSFWQLTNHILFGRRPDVILYYPQHFNRSKDGTNPYFAPIIGVCKENGLRYLMLEEPDDGTHNPRDPQCMKADFFWGVTIIMRKVLRLCCKNKSSYEIDYLIGRLWSIFALGKLKSKTYICISNSMHEVLAGLNPKGVAYDYQHGLIQNGQEGFFESEGKLNGMFNIPNVGIMLWGELYKKSFAMALSAERMNNIIKVIGYPIPTLKIVEKREERRFILISLQMTVDNNSKRLNDYVEMFEDTLNVIKEFGVPVLIKHHPRFNNVINLEHVLEKYSFAKFTSKPLFELVPETLLQITWYSTTGFEYANYGIPTFYLYNEKIPEGKNIFYKQYNYPLYEGMQLREVIKRIKEKSTYYQDCKTVKEWYDSAYAPFDKKLMLKILVGDED